MSDFAAESGSPHRPFSAPPAQRGGTTRGAFSRPLLYSLSTGRQQQFYRTHSPPGENGRSGIDGVVTAHACATDQDVARREDSLIA